MKGELSDALEVAVNSDGEVYFRDKRDIDYYIFKIDNGCVYFKRESHDMWENEMPGWMVKELLKK